MMTVSSPIPFPATIPSPTLKRPYPSQAHGHEGPRHPKARARGGFLMNDSSDEDEEDDDSGAGPAPKRILVEPSTIRASGALAASQGTRPVDVVLTSLPGLGEDDVDELEIPDAQPAGPSIDVDEELRYQALFDLQGTEPGGVEIPSSGGNGAPFEMTTCSGRMLPIRQRKATVNTTYESMVAARSRTKEGRAKRSFYGIEIHALIDAATEEAKAGRDAAANATASSKGAPIHPDQPIASVEEAPDKARQPRKTLLWTEKYRARKFMDLVGDDLTNRQVLRWLKRWDALVFPHAAKSKAAAAPRRATAKAQRQTEEEKPHRKILMLTGPPGLGKTTLAHVCARQAGYEVLEINASDERSKDVVKGRIRTSLGTENVRTVEQGKTADGKPQKIARPVCVVVDEVDGVVSGTGGSGDGGFVKALMDLMMTDQKNSAASSGGPSAANGAGRRNKKKGDDFRQMRPLILICNDVYHVSLRPLRQSGLAEIIHVGKPTVDAVVTRLKDVFEKEGIPCEKDAARKLCEAAWGMTSGIDARRGAESTVEGDLRGIMVVGEWVAGRYKASAPNGDLFLTRQWIDKNIVHELAHGGGGARGIGRGGTKDVVARVFQEGAGFPKQSGAGASGTATPVSAAAKKAAERNARREQPQARLGFAEQDKKYAMARLSEMVETSGEVDRIMTEILAEYPGREFNDDCYLTKPNEAYEWMHFHDACSTRLFSGQEWELAPYLGQPVLACHHLFASPRRHLAAAGYDKHWGAATGGDDKAPPPVPFSGPRADYEAREAEKHNRAVLQSIQSQLSPSLGRSFRSPEQIATDFLSYLVRLVSPDVKPVVINGASGGGDSSGGNKWGASVASVRRESEKVMVRRAAEVLADVGIELLRGKIEEANPSAFNRAQWVYRMEPDLDALASFETMGSYTLATQAPTRYAVRQVLEQELRKTHMARENAARQARFQAGGGGGGGSAADLLHPRDPGKAEPGLDGPKTSNKSQSNATADDAGVPDVVAPTRDFFGRIVAVSAEGPVKVVKTEKAVPVWVTFNEGLNNAVRKPISLEEFMRGL